jgi:hypothetical protein
MLDAVVEIVRNMTLTMLSLLAEVALVSIGLALLVAGIRRALRHSPHSRSPRGPRAEQGLRPVPVRPRPGVSTYVSGPARDGPEAVQPLTTHP